MASHRESVDLRDFDAPGRALPVGPAKRLAFYSDLCRFATTAESGAQYVTAIKCRKRPQRKACPGFLLASWRDLPSAVDWACPACSTSGVITGWQGTDVDLRQLDLEPDSEVLPVAIHVSHYAELLDLARVESDWIKAAFRVDVDPDDEAIILLLTPQELNCAKARLLRAALASTNRRRAERLAAIARPWIGLGLVR